MNATQYEALALMQVLETLGRSSDQVEVVDRLAEACARIARYGASLLTLATPEGTIIGAYNLTEQELEHFRNKAIEVPFEERAENRRRIRAQAYPGTNIAYIRHALNRGFNVVATPVERQSAVGDWDPRDTLYILIRGAGGEDVGILSLDAPEDGCAPREDQLDHLRVAERLVRIASSIVLTRVYQQKIQQSEERFRALVEQAADGFLVIDRHGRLAEVNEAASELLGRPREVLLSTGIEELVPEGEGVLEVTRNWPDAPATVETRLVRASGDPVPVELRLGVVEFGSRRLLLVLVRDITARRKLEAGLRHTQKMEAMGRLAGVAAHDFNNLLQVIVSSTEFALASLDRGRDPERYLRTISSATRTAADIARQLLSFGRRQELRPELVELDHSIRDTETMLQRILGEGSALRLELGAGGGWVRLDPKRLQEILLNLAANARDAMPDGGTLTVRTRVNASPEGGDHDWLELELLDTGIGMDPEVLERAFEPFFTTKAEEQGSGLGLAAVLGIVEQSGGEVRAESTRDRGTSFHLRFPRCEPGTADR